jgi:hypothetical protein
MSLTGHSRRFEHAMGMSASHPIATGLLHSAEGYHVSQ